MKASNGASSDYPVLELPQLDADQAREVHVLAAAADAADGAHPLSESVLLGLTTAEPDTRHLLVETPQGDLAGYAYLHRAADGVTAEIVVHPAQRRRGLGRRLLAAVTERAGSDGDGTGLRIWAHGDHPSAAALAVDLGFDRARLLHQFRRSLVEPPPEPRLPEGVTLRAFRPGQDDAAWLAVNSRAFAHHPEQGRWTARDLALRFASPWFDPAGFLLAVRTADDQLLGFHWTKVHDAGEAGGSRIGEVYVLGVDPQAHGGGLGRALALAGLRHLHERGLDRVMLYVDESNQAAVSLYRRLGFAPWTGHVQYHRAG
jgi:mycothiol synthase